MGFKFEEIDAFKCDSELKERVVSLYTMQSGRFDAKRICEEALRMLIKWYEQYDVLNPEALLGRYQRELEYRSEYGKLCFHELFERNLRGGQEWNNSLRRLAFYALQNFDYRTICLDDSKLKKLDTYFFGITRHMMLYGWDGYTFARPGFRIIKNALESQFGKKFPPLYTDLGEALDTEIVHWLTVGCFQSGKHNKVVVFTTERLEKWQMRATCYFSFLNFLFEHDNASLFPGVIFQVDQTTGEIKGRLDLYEGYRHELANFRLGQDRFLS